MQVCGTCWSSTLLSTLGSELQPLFVGIYKGNLRIYVCSAEKEHCTDYKGIGKNALSIKLSYKGCMELAIPVPHSPSYTVFLKKKRTPQFSETLA